MTATDILEELKKLPRSERLRVVEAAVQMIREDFQEKEIGLAPTGRKRHLAEAAQTLLPDYAIGGDLTAFTVLDGEDFGA